MTVSTNSQTLDRSRHDGEEMDMFDLDLQLSKGGGGTEPQITSYSLCTPGCAYTGSWNSYCC